MFTFNPNKSNPNFILISSLFALLLLCSIICIVAGETSSVLNKSKKEIQKDSNFWQALEELAEKRFDFSADKDKLKDEKFKFFQELENIKTLKSIQSSEMKKENDAIHTPTFETNHSQL